MKTACVLSTLFVGAASFGVAPKASSTWGQRSALYGHPSEDQMTADQLEIKKIAEKWTDIRLLSRDEAKAQLDGEWLEAYNRFYEKYDKDMDYMQEIADKLQTMIEPPKVQKKSKGQKKRDAWAKVQAREAARATQK